MSNTWIICPSAGDNVSKGTLIPHTFPGTPVLGRKARSQDPALEEEPASHQLVGGVIDHQG